jgi:hypothetical protein
VPQGRDNYRIHEYLRLYVLASVGTSLCAVVIKWNDKKTSEAIVADFIAGEEEKKAVRLPEVNYWSEGDPAIVARSRIFLYVRVVNSERVSLDRIERIIGLVITRMRLREN